MTTNGADFSVAGSFRFYTPRALAHLFPLSGPISGGSALGLRSGTGTFDIGDDAMAHYTCRVGEETFVATRVDDELFCVTPPLNAANISMVGIDASTPLPFAVSVNGQQFSIEDITFIYIPSVFEAQAPLSLVPISGPTTGGTAIYVIYTPRFFVGATSPTCRVGSRAIVGSYDPLVDAVRCVMPPLDTGAYPVEVSSNGQQFSDQARRSSLTQVPHTSPTHKSHTQVPHTSFTPPCWLVILISQPYCFPVHHRRFCFHHSPCLYPPTPQPLQFHEQDLDGTERLFVAYAPPRLDGDASFPTSAPLRSAASLRLAGINLSNGSEYVCAFSHAAALVGYTPSDEGAYGSWGVGLRCEDDNSTCTAASAVSSSEVRCLTPRVKEPRLARLRLSLNGQQFTAHGGGGDLFVLFYPPPTVRMATPAGGAAEGTSSLVVYGEGFMPAVVGSLGVGGAVAATSAPRRLPEVRCAFGKQSTPASVFSDIAIRCLSHCPCVPTCHATHTCHISRSQFPYT